MSQVSHELEEEERMDFYTIKERTLKSGAIEVYPDFKVTRSKDLMIRGESFYAVWNENEQLWTTDEYAVQKLIDADLMKYRDELQKKTVTNIHAKLLSDYSSRSWSEFKSYIRNISDNSTQLDETLTFSNSEVKKSDYVSKKLPYPLEEGSIEAYDELISTLYLPEERAKIEWAIGAIISGDAKEIQKFIVLYGEAGTGKSTVLNIIAKLFEGYYTTFEAKALTSSSNAFATEVFKNNPLVAIQHDGDLSRIEDNTKLNSIVSHEYMTVNEKYKASYMSKINSFLFMGTNKPVKITDAKSGIIRRLIDVKPSGKKVPVKRYQALMQQIDFELGAIAHYCLTVYREMGKNYYSNYKPLDMILQTDVFFNFVESNYFLLKEQDGITLKQAYDMYKKYCEEALIDFKLPRHKFREELRNYYDEFLEVTRVNGKQLRSYYSGFRVDKFVNIAPTVIEVHESPLVLDQDTSLLDDICALYPAQYANRYETPRMEWSKNKNILKDLDTSKLHYLKLTKNHIVIDFDLKDDTGEKSLERNIEAASKWPPTYAEFSKSGRGIHLHYIYDGDVDTLMRVYDTDIEVKIFNGDSSLRRKLTKCNNIPIATINSGIPLKGEPMINFDTVYNEKSIRTLVKKNLNKDIHPATKPSIDFIKTILDEAYASGMTYDISDMAPSIMAFANGSTNQSRYCLKVVTDMKFKSEEESAAGLQRDDEPIVFFDVEVYPNLFLVVWKYRGSSKKVRMFNPSPQDIEELLKSKLVGFNCRRYDNHILYARYIGYTNEQLFNLSQRIIENNSGTFGEAYNASYTDIYDYATKKQSLKKWEIELGIPHQEMELPWDEPVAEELWEKVALYCENDVEATEAVFEHTQADFMGRMILSELSGLTPNDSTQNHASKIIFGDDRNYKNEFVYTDLSKMFPGYKFERGVSTYRGVEAGEGGYVSAKPGVYSNVALLDIVSMHPTSIILLNMFGKYTVRFEEIVEARVAIKNHEIEKAEKMLGGILSKYLKDENLIDPLAYALKIIINIIYGLTSARFDNKFKDPRNIDNIVAKRGSLFMIDLQRYLEDELNIPVIHIKTDSIKVADLTDDVLAKIKEFATKFGYTFEHEATYDRLALVNNAVYIAHDDSGWTAVGAQFKHPYVFKKIFSKEDISIDDLMESKEVRAGTIYLDFDEDLPEGEHDMHFVGRVGSFLPIQPGKGGARLYRVNNEKNHAITGTKNYRWMESEMVKALGKENDIDYSYYNKLIDEALDTISKFGDVEWFRNI